MSQKPWLWNAAVTLTEGTKLKAADCGVLSVLTVCASRWGHKERNHTVARKLLMSPGLASSWSLSFQMKRRSLWSLCAQSPIHTGKGHSRSVTSQYWAKAWLTWNGSPFTLTPTFAPLSRVPHVQHDQITLPWIQTTDGSSETTPPLAAE